ncbi:MULTISPECIES: urease accessory protein UreD [Streptomycetaceae]|uniref:Urease accessory protein UreD n=1 Tax=Streptantibioticus cattleyicolor (strain ATCC 35852 / DSM 46488 / JCM 4925 / NBRC 14057 / NRRL 8057) TaxID=1003195 RepID=F8JPM7_STREN|nr:urease accessory protein UreD [Streptantibioticus cattleyicolor]AEW92719.1 urease accessory protein [Streptantibioticus cattleyicolor NRRL 8057 = DSM 46488]MYS57485.1 urease accessory protein UreD [Streptomyces sp. SID5468]CCB73073.1 Urease accessory protein ureD [Streptantibioticus cattleyicolor NRRL 8057 = DSM 46488]
MTAVLEQPPHPAGVRATARIVAEADGHGGTRLPVLDGEGPLAPRRTRPSGPGARVTMVGAMTAPLGGDRLRVETEVRAGARLDVDAAAATVSLPGVTGAPAGYDVRLTVGPGAELRWLPEPLIAAAGSDLVLTTEAELAADARLVLREEQVLGRAGEAPGRLVTRLSVRRRGRPLLDQELAFGPGVPGWSGPAVLAGYAAVGQLLLAGPEFADGAGEAYSLPAAAGEGEAVVTPLAGPAVLVTAVAPDALRLRRLLDQGWARLAR